MTTPTDAQNAVDAATTTGSPVITKTILASVLSTIVAAITTVYVVASGAWKRAALTGGY